eukprot:2507884-Pyramimonas_sp.AAC.2
MEEVRRTSKSELSTDEAKHMVTKGRAARGGGGSTVARNPQVPPNEQGIYALQNQYFTEPARFPFPLVIAVNKDPWAKSNPASISSKFMSFSPLLILFCRLPPSPRAASSARCRSARVPTPLFNVRRRRRIRLSCDQQDTAPLEMKGSLKRVSPEEIVFAFIFAVNDEL